MVNIKKDEQMQKGSIGPMVAGIAGVAIGATTVVALSNKKVRKQIGKVLEDAVDQGKEALVQLQDRVQMQVKQIGKRAKVAFEKEKVKTSRRLALNTTRH